MRRFAATIRGGQDIIGNLNPFERWNIDNCIFGTNPNIEQLTGIYNDINLVQNNVDLQPELNVGFIEFRDDIVTNSTFTPVNNTSGEIIFVFNNIVTSKFQPIFQYGYGYSQNRFVLFANNNRLNVIQRIPATGRFDKVNVAISAGIHVVSFNNENGFYNFYIDDPSTPLAKSVINGTDSGKWYEDQAKDRISLNELFTDYPASLDLKDLIVFNNVLTSTERTGVFNELKAIYNL